MKRYVIMAKENYPGATIKEICRCDTNAKVIRDALADYTVTGSQGTRIYKFNHVEILEVSARKPKEARAQMKKPMRNIHELSGVEGGIRHNGPPWKAGEPRVAAFSSISWPISAWRWASSGSIPRRAPRP